MSLYTKPEVKRDNPRFGVVLYVAEDLKSSHNGITLRIMVFSPVYYCQLGCAMLFELRIMSLYTKLKENHDILGFE
jgi:hypothetical protein